MAAALDQQGTDFLVIRVALEKLFEQRLLGRLGRAYPGQGQAPALVGVTADILALGQFGQRANAFLTRALVARQVLGEEQRDIRVVGVFPLQALHTTASLAPVLIDIAQVVVELETDLPLPWLAAQCAAIDIDSLGALIGLDQQAGLIQQLLVGRIEQANILFQQQGLARHWLQRLQALQILASLGRLAGLHRDQAETIQRIRMVGIEQQQLVPHLCGALGLFLALPELPLLDQQATWVFGLGLNTAMGQNGQQRQGQRAVAEHGDSQSVCTRPSAANR